MNRQSDENSLIKADMPTIEARYASELNLVFDSPAIGSPAALFSLSNRFETAQIHVQCAE